MHGLMRGTGNGNSEPVSTLLVAKFPEKDLKTINIIGLDFKS